MIIRPIVHGIIHGVAHKRPVFNLDIVAPTPTHQATGAKAEGTGNVTVVWPAHQANDVALLFVETNGNEAAVLGTPAGFVQVTGSPQVADTGGDTTRLTVFWCRASSGAQASPVITDPGNHCEAVIVTYRGCRTFDIPYSSTAGGTTEGVPTAAIVVPGASTEAPNCRVVVAIANGGGWDASGYTNANLTGITERFDDYTGLASAGGLSIADGAFVGPGEWGDTSATMGAVQTCGFMSIALTGSSGGGSASEVLNLTSLGTPVTAARTWATGITDDGYFIIQTYNYPDDVATEWWVFNLGAGTVDLVEGPNGIFSNSNFQCGATTPSFSDADGANQLRASNGRIFFPLRGLNWAYYEPADHLIHTLDEISDPGSSHAIIYNATFGADGLIYASTQTDSGQDTLPAVISLDPDTLATTLIGHVGNLTPLMYGYYVAPEADGSRVYVAVGQDPWELWSITSGGVATHLDPGTGPYTHIEFDVEAESWRARFSKAAGGQEDYWIADGVLYPSASGFTPRDVTPTGPVQTADAHDVDWSDAGQGIVRWRDRGSVGAYTDINFNPTTAPVDLQNITELPDHDLLVAAANYAGFARYDVTFTELPAAIMSQAIFAERGAWICGYPNGALYFYDSTLAWNPGTNPESKGAYSVTDMKYPYFLQLYNNRLYCLGRRERSGVGGGLGYFDTVGETFSGHHDDPLGNYTPRGMVVLGAAGKVVVSGETIDHTPAKLLVYDLNLAPIEELEVNEDTNTGLLFHDTGEIVVGVTSGGAYRYNLDTGSLLGTTAFGAAVTAVTQRADGQILVMAGTTLIQMDPSTLAQTELLGGVVLASPITYLSWVDSRIYATAGATVYQIV